MKESRLPVCRTLDKLGIPKPTFSRWYDRYQSGSPVALDDHWPKPGQVWNRIPDDIRDRVVKLALDEPTLSPRELAVRFTDTEKYFVSEASAYRILKAHDLITSTAFIIVKASDELKSKTKAPDQFGQADLIYPKAIDWARSTCPQCLMATLASSYVEDVPYHADTAALPWVMLDGKYYCTLQLF